MLSECKTNEYYDSINSKGAADSLFLILIFDGRKWLTSWLKNYGIKRKTQV